jgi:hypothetical protein
MTNGSLQPDAVPAICARRVRLKIGSYVRLYADEAGVSHFEDVEVALPPIDYAPPAPPLNVLSLFPTARCGLLGAATDWGGDIPHPAPRRQLFCCMRGGYEITASDGTTRRFRPGDLLLFEDTSGEGHATRILEDTLVFTVALSA